jgi:hypothetical protein
MYPRFSADRPPKRARRYRLANATNDRDLLVLLLLVVLLMAFVAAFIMSVPLPTS